MFLYPRTKFDRCCNGRDRVLRHCRLVSEQPGDETAVQALIIWLNTAFRRVGNGSRSRGREEAEDSAKMVRERGLVDEFVSIRLIDFMAAAKAILDETLHPLAASDDRFYRSLAIADEHLVRDLTRSRLTAKAMRYPIADGDSPFSPEQFVERSGRLKKHFEAVLALDREAHPVDEQLHIWVTCPTALMGGMCGFVQHLHSRKRIYLPTGRPQGAKVNDENRIHRQAIRDGRDFSTEIEGLSDLEPNTRAVTKPTDDLRKGLEVAVKSLQAK